MPIEKSTSESKSSAKNYEYYLKLAREKNFEELKKLKIIYEAGVDFSGRQVVILIGDIPKHIHTDDLFLYFILVMDKIVENDYTFIYIRVKGATTPSIGWLRKVYEIFTRKYKKNLKRLFIVNPNFFIKTACNLFRPFISSKFWKKLSFLKEVDDLTKFISKNQLQLPDKLLNIGQQYNPNRLFGVDLELIMKLPMNQNKDIPYIVENAIIALHKSGLNAEGIFRLPGSSNRVKEIKDEFDKGNIVDLTKEDIHVTASVLKQFLRDLPNPLIPYELYEIVIGSYKEDDKTSKELLSSSMQFLPKVNAILLYELLKLLKLISNNSEHNKMTTKNLAIVFGPNILKSKDESPELILQHMNTIPSILQILIDDYEYILSSTVKKFGYSLTNIE